MGAPAEHHWTAGERLPDGRWAPGTLVTTPTGGRAVVLPYGVDVPNPDGSDEVFVQPVGRPERPWQLWSSGELTEIPEETPTTP